MSDSIDRQKVLATLDFADNALDEERTVEKYKELLAECVKALPPAENAEITEDQVSKWCKEHDYKIVSTKLLEDFLKRH